MQPAPTEVISRCRCCDSTQLHDLIDFGTSPLADRLMRPGDDSPEYVAPLTLSLCADCGMCQIRETVAPDVLFGADYPYYSSVSASLLAHFGASARAIMERQALGPDSLVIEAASNDGYMLRNFAEAGIPVLGIDPAPGPAAVAEAAGIPTRNTFFSEDLAQALLSEGKQADVFLANNVLAHVADTVGFLRGVKALLKPDGIAVFEFPYLGDLVEKRAFDTIYHQHLLYISAQAARRLFARAGLHLNDMERLKIHGGSVRATVSHQPGESPRLQALLGEEDARSMHTPAYFDRFCADLRQMREQTRATLEALQAEGKRVVGYGAAAKATTLLQYFGLDRRHLDFIVDKSTWKQGLEMPGNRIPIKLPTALDTHRPEIILILAWNFAAEIIAENQRVQDWGARFLVPVPEFRDVRAGDLEASL